MLPTRSLDTIPFRDPSRRRSPKSGPKAPNSNRSVAKYCFFLPGESFAQRAAETEEGGDEVQEQVIELDQSEDEFGAFEQLDTPEDPFGDTGDQNLPEADLQGTSSQTDMGFKRKPSSSLLDLLEGQPGKDALGKSQPKLPPPTPSKPEHP